MHQILVNKQQIVYFFFSSRRRHTRLQGDWSSDVCSSDLGILVSEDGFVLSSGVGGIMWNDPESGRSGWLVAERWEERRVGKECRCGGRGYADKRNEERKRETEE